MRLRRFILAAAVISALSAGTAFADGPVGSAYQFTEEAGPGVGSAGAVVSGDQAAIRDRLIAATEQSNALKTYEADYSMFVAMAINDVRLMDINGIGGLKYDANDASNPKIAMDMDMTMSTPDGSVEPSFSRMDMYLTDGYYYIDQDGVKQKAEMPIEALLTQLTASGDSISQSVGMMRDFTQATADNGVTTISYSYDTAQLNALVDQALDTAMGAQGLDMSMLGDVTMDFNVADAQGEMRLSESGELLGETLSMNMGYVVTAEGESIDIGIHVAMDYNFTSKGQPVQMPVIDPAAYTEIPSGGAVYEGEAVIGGADAATDITVAQ